MIQSKEEYDQLSKDLVKRLDEIKVLKRLILDYENENLIPEFNSLDELREFLADEPEEDIIFKYNNAKYSVLDIEEFIREYGHDQWSQCVWGSGFGDLLCGGSVGVIERINKQ